MKIALIGYGKMGKIIEKLALEKGHQIVEIYDGKNPFENSDKTNADVAIEFSEPSLVKKHIYHAIELNLPIVVGTTAWYNDFEEISQKVIESKSSLFYATNFSLGVNLFFKANEFLAELMSGYAQYQCELIEIHHTEKKDAPSGTAITTAEGIINNHSQYSSWNLKSSNEMESNSSISITALREPNVPGTHHVVYESSVDKISLQHEAKNREGFTIGSIIAAEWLINQTGIFTMSDLLNFKK